MHDDPEARHTQQRIERPRWWRRRWFKLLASLALLACLALLITAEYVLHHAEPILRKRIIETLSARFDAPVELDRVDISLFKGIEVTGYGLRIPISVAAGADALPYPLIAVQHFAFRTSFEGLLHQPTHVAEVHVDGLELHIPPPALRQQILGPKEGTEPADPRDPKIKPRIAITVSRLQCTDVKLFIESGKPGKDPLQFNISSLAMSDLGPNQAMLYDAQLTNPKPAGEVHATGHFGPWAGGATQAGVPPDPGQTPLDGDYTFDHADLNTIKGIGGTLASTGHFSGILDRLIVDGRANVPDFSLDISNRPVPLQAEFHAIVDGTSGDTDLEPVHARLAGSDFTVSGKVVKVKHAGHDIQLDVDIPHGRMQDFLRLAVKTDPPLMSGILAMKARLHIPPGNVRVPVKMSMQGAFHLEQIHFNNARMQDRIDGLSARAEGKPQEVAEVGHDRQAEVHSQLAARFAIDHGVVQVTDVHYALPGALILLNGVYSMDGRLFEFKGHVRTEATASQMVSGWKSWLLKPVDHFLKKDGAGLELPIMISGTEGDLHLGLALHGTDETPGQMLAGVKGRDHAKRELTAARREAAQADADDARAAKAPTLEAAEQAHNAAVRRRAEAQSRVLNAQRPSDTPNH